MSILVGYSESHSDKRNGDILLIPRNRGSRNWIYRSGASGIYAGPKAVAQSPHTGRLNRKSATGSSSRATCGLCRSIIRSIHAKSIAYFTPDGMANSDTPLQ